MGSPSTSVSNPSQRSTTSRCLMGMGEPIVFITLISPNTSAFVLQLPLKAHASQVATDAAS